MKTSLPKQLGKATLRAVLAFLTFNLLSILSDVVFEANLFAKDMLSSRALGAWNAVFLFFIFESTVFAFHRVGFVILVDAFVRIFQKTIRCQLPENT